VSKIDTEDGPTAPLGFDSADFGFPPRPELPARVVSSKVRLSARFVELWRSRELFVFFVRRDLKVKYKGSVLGLLWSMLNPAVVLAVYYVVFKYFLKNPTPYFALYLFSGLLVWNFFSTALIGASSAVVGAAGIVKKVAFPREILALSQVGTATMFFFFQSGVMILFLLGFQYAPDWKFLTLIPFALVDLIIFAAAIAVFLSAVNVYLRDVEHLIQVLIATWFWGVPIIYSFDVVDKPGHRWLGIGYLVDPIVPVILTFQRAIYGKVSYLITTVVKTPKYLIVNGKVVTQTVTTHITTTPQIVTTPYIKNGHVFIRTITKNVPNRVYELANYPFHFYVIMLAWVFVVAVLLFIGALLVFGRLEGNFAEEL
jgi:ABC-2 type transport system permease protein